MDRWYTLEALPAVAADLLDTHSGSTVFTLTGPLGSGKTTLVAEVCRQLGVTETVSSPTYGIVQEYATPQGTVYHLDCYRLESTEEAIDAGIEELLQGAYRAVFVEWPTVIEPLLPPGVVFLQLSHDPAGTGRRHLQAKL